MSKHGEEGDLADMGMLLGYPAKELAGQKRKGEMQEKENVSGRIRMLLREREKQLALSDSSLSRTLEKIKNLCKARREKIDKQKGEMQEEECDLGRMGMLLGDVEKRLAVNKGEKLEIQGSVEMESDSSLPRTLVNLCKALREKIDKRKGEMQEEEGDLGRMGMLLGDAEKRLAVNKGEKLEIQEPVEMESDSSLPRNRGEKIDNKRFLLKGEVDSTGQPVIQAFQGPCSEGPQQTPTTHKSEGSEKMGKRAAEENLEDDPEFRMFREWAKEAEKEYKNHEEEYKRFQIWRSTKEMVDLHNSHVQPGMDRYALTFFSDLTDSEKDQYYMKIPGPCPDVSLETPTTRKSEWQQKMEKCNAEEKAAFDKWVGEHKRDYGNELERKIGFTRHRLNMRRINTLIKENPSRYSTSPVELGILLDQALTLSEIESLLIGCTAPLLKD